MNKPRITSVAIKNYKSIGSAEVALAPLTVLVGRNGAGKSNFIDVLWLVSDALQSTMDSALRQRGGIGEVRRRSSGHPTHFAISLRVSLGDGRSAGYAFVIGARKDGGFVVQREKAAVSSPGSGEAHFEVAEGKLVQHSEHLAIVPQIFPDRLFLTTASAVSPFRELFDALSQMYFYNISPNEIRLPQPHDSGDVLLRSGRNLASLVRRLRSDDVPAYERIQDYLRVIVPGLEHVEPKLLGPSETLEFRQKVGGNSKPWRFFAASMSDGTLRSLGILTAVFQTNARRLAPTLIGIEEPESTIHPGSAGILMGALIEASKHRQVIATTHSPDLLDCPDLAMDSVRVVENHDGETIIAMADQSSIDVVRDELFTPGELLRKNQIAPASVEQSNFETPDMFKM